MNKPIIMTEQIRDLTIEQIADLSAPELACLLDDLGTQKASLRQVEGKLSGPGMAFPGACRGCRPRRARGNARIVTRRGRRMHAVGLCRV